MLSFVLTAGMARKYGASILLRIDDMDHERLRKEYLDDIFETLKFLEIPWDEGPRSTEEQLATFSQKNRSNLYREAMNHLQEKNSVFACACSRSKLEQAANSNRYPGTCRDQNISLDASNVQWRLKTNPDAIIEMHDLLKGTVSTQLPVGMESFQVRKKNGDPSYQLTSLMDDLHFGIDLIVRGEDLWDSSLAQLSLARRLDKPSFLAAKFLHHPLLKLNGNEKLSKSAGSTSIQYLRRSGLNMQEIYAKMAVSVGSDQHPQNWLELYQILVKNWVDLP
jgi:glutamyl-tRNA synthetase